jgi:hypothetical protein
MVRAVALWNWPLARLLLAPVVISRSAPAPQLLARVVPFAWLSVQVLRAPVVT